MHLENLMKNIFYFIGLFSCFTYSQVGGETVYNFLSVPTSARQVALGGNVLTLLDDINQPVYNPSVISQDLDFKLGINYVNFLADINYGSVNFAHFFNKHFGTLHGNITFVDYGNFIAADDNGNEIGSFKSKDISASIGYARNIPWSNFYVGANVKFIQSIIDTYSSNGVGADVALLYYKENKPYTVTGVIRNIGYQINPFDEVKEDLPLNIMLGASYKLYDVPLKWHITLDNLQQWNLSVPNPSDSETNLSGNTSSNKISFLDNAFRHVTIGGELFPDKGFNIRFGYNFRRAKELKLIETRTFAGISAGFGIKFGKVKFNYAYTKYHPASNTSTFSLQIDLNSRIR